MSTRGFIIERKEGTGDFEAIDWLEPGSTSYDDWAVSQGTSYTYRVKASGVGGDNYGSDNCIPAGPVDPETALADTITGNTTSTESATYTLTFSSTSPSSDTVDYWVVDWGDGWVDRVDKAASGPTTAGHVYLQDGNYTPGAIAFDAEGGKFTATLVDGEEEPFTTLSVADVAPTLTITGPDSVVQGSTYTLLLKSDDLGICDTLTGWTVVWGDGSENSDAVPMADGLYWQATHAYTDPNPTGYTVLATASDANGSFPAVSTSVTVTYALAAPSSLSPTVVSDREVDVTWTDNSTGEDSFQIQASVDNGATWQDAGFASAGATGAQLTGLLPATDYLFRVRAFIATGQSPWSATESATTDDNTGAPAVPANVTATVYSSPPMNAIDVNWSPSAGATSYEVAAYSPTQYQPEYDDWSISSVLGTTTTFGVWMNGHPGFSFKVRAVNANGHSDWSDIHSVLLAGTRPIAPVLSVASVAAGEVDLTWTWTGSSSTGWQLWVLRGGQMCSPTSFATTWGDHAVAVTGMDPSATYEFRLQAWGVSGPSEYSIVTATTPAATTTTPSGLLARAVSDSQIALTWADTSGGKEGFNVYCSTTESFTGITPQYVPPGTTSFLAGGLTSATQCFFILTGVVQGGESAPTQPTAAQTAALSTVSVTAIEAMSKDDMRPAVFEFSRTGPTDEALIVYYQLHGTAVAGIEQGGQVVARDGSGQKPDYLADNPVTPGGFKWWRVEIPKGESSVRVSLQPYLKSLSSPGTRTIQCIVEARATDRYKASTVEAETVCVQRAITGCIATANPGTQEHVLEAMKWLAPNFTYWTSGNKVCAYMKPTAVADSLPDATTQQALVTAYQAAMGFRTSDPQLFNDNFAKKLVGEDVRVGNKTEHIGGVTTQGRGLFFSYVIVANALALGTLDVTEVGGDSPTQYTVNGTKINYNATEKGGRVAGGTNATGLGHELAHAALGLFPNPGAEPCERLTCTADNMIRFEHLQPLREHAENQDNGPLIASNTYNDTLGLIWPPGSDAPLLKAPANHRVGAFFTISDGLDTWQKLS